MKASLKWIAVMLICAWTSFSISAQTSTDGPRLLIRMPDEAPLANQPTDDDIARFFEARGTYLHMTPQDLLRDTSLARQVLGQRQIFDELAAFQTQHRMAVKVKFITWADAFRYFADYVSDASNPPVVAQLGDTWAAYFRSLGVMPYEQRHTWDVRLLWYWEDLVDADDIADGDRFMATCQKLQESPAPGLLAPLAIPTAPDWNLLHDLSIWLYNAGLPSLIATDKKLGLLPWKEAIFAGPAGERAAQFLIDLAKRGYVALPEKLSTELAEDFLDRKYAMAILGPWVVERAEKRFGSEWRAKLRAALPPTIGARAATTIKGGSLLVVLDPSRGQDVVGANRARRLVDFFRSTESQRRYTQALGALPANPHALAEFPHFTLFQAALARGKTYPQIPEWAPVVENLATRDNLYAFWKRLSALTATQATAGQAEQSAREKLILAALYSAQADINKELSPGKLSVLWPWLLAVGLLLVTVAVVTVGYRRVERNRVEELRQARDSLATLQRRMAAMPEVASESVTPASPETPTLSAKGYPALYLDTVRRKVLLRKIPTQPLEEVIHGAEYDLFRHIIECLQVGWYETHWIWSYIIWPTAQPKFPKEAFATHCTKLRKKVEEVWRLGRLLGRGSHHGGAIPIEVRDVHFYTDAAAEDGAYPVWWLFHAAEQSVKAYKAERWDEARRHIEQLLRIDPDNWPGNLLLCQLVMQHQADPDDPLARKAIEFAHKQRAHYEPAVEKISHLPEEKVNPEQQERMQSRWESLQQIISRLPSPKPEPQPPTGRRPWRTRDQLTEWASYLNGETRALPGDEIRVVQDVQRFVVRRLHWASPEEAEDQFREFVQDLALDTSSWPDERLPSSETAFKYRALDYVLAGVRHLPDDDESKASTKAQNLRKLWSTRAQLRKRLEREPASDELAQECQRRYGWGRAAFDHLLGLEKFCRPLPFDESRWEDVGDLDVEE
jgi:ABC-type glycerol-3-phosphate transport system substrate-binding protein